MLVLVLLLLLLLLLLSSSLLLLFCNALCFFAGAGSIGVSGDSAAKTTADGGHDDGALAVEQTDRRQPRACGCAVC